MDSHPGCLTDARDNHVRNLVARRGSPPRVLTVPQGQGIAHGPQLCLLWLGKATRSRSRLLSRQWVTLGLIFDAAAGGLQASRVWGVAALQGSIESGFCLD